MSMTTARTSPGTRKAFTLIEMIVSVGLFAVVMVVALGAYLSLINLDRKARATNDLVTNLTFAVDVMERGIRTGTNFSCDGGTNCWPGAGAQLSFTSEQGQTVTYLIHTNGSSSQIGECLSGGACDPVSSLPITDPRITITRLNFYVNGVGSGDNKQPYIIFVISGTMTPDALSGPINFTVQSTGSQRIIEL
jgi:prepilin-type N-terminal cleavage/methylation domain-containing protein